MVMTEALTASLEDYLKAIYNIIAEKQAIRPKDLTKRLKVSGASVTGALQSLAARELIHYVPHDVITLTPAGRDIAQDVTRRHEVLKDFLMNILSVAEEDAEEAACRMEHAVSKDILERFIRFAEFIEVCPRAGTRWISGFSHYCDRGRSEENCEKCIVSTLEAARKRRRPEGRQETKMEKLSNVEPGHKARVMKVITRGSAKKRIIEMGILPGTVIEVERVAPMGGPIDVKVKGYHLSLRKDEAGGIEVEPL